MKTEFTYDQLSFLQTLDTALLLAIAKGKINVQTMARDELAARGVDKKGAWVGFDKAAFIHWVGQ